MHAPAPSPIAHEDEPVARDLHPGVGLARAATAYAILTLTFLSAGFAVTRVFDSTLGAWDTQMAEWLVERRTPTLNAVTAVGSTIGDTIPVIAVGVVLSGALLVSRRDPRPLVLIAIALTVELLVFLTVSYTVDRPRPAVERLGSLPSTGSFPSGHAAAALVLYGGMALVLSAPAHRRAVRPALIVLGSLVAVYVGLSRAYRGMHYLSDVAAGWLLGSLCLLAAVIAVRGARRRLADDEYDGPANRRTPRPSWAELRDRTPASAQSVMAVASSATARHAARDGGASIVSVAA